MWAKHGRYWQAADLTMERLAPGTYSMGKDGNGRLALMRSKRVVDSLIELPDSPAVQILDTVDSFLSQAADYVALGYTHKLSFLLKGPPGTGKTSILAMASQRFIQMGGLVISVQKMHPNDFADCFEQLRAVEPDTPLLILLEGVERLQCGALEEFLEGETSVDKSVIIATTNDYERLAKQFRRPGRFDVTIEVGPPSAELRTAYLKDKLPHSVVGTWVEKTAGFSIAHLKVLVQRVVLHGQDLDKEIAQFRELALVPVAE